MHILALYCLRDESFFSPMIILCIVNKYNSIYLTPGATRKIVPGQDKLTQWGLEKNGSIL